MNKFVYIVTLTLFVCASIKAQSNAETQIREVYYNIVTAYGSAKPAPRLIFYPKDIKAVTPALYSATPQPTIKVDLEFYKLCRTFDKDSSNALAIVLSHELAHYYNDHTFCSDFAFAVRKSNQELAQKLKSVSKSDKISRETQADYQGLFYAAIAGYNPFDTYEKTIDAIYKAYQIPEVNFGYPTKTERKQMALTVWQKTKDLYEKFKMASQLEEEKKYAEAITLFQEINTYFPSRENYNNVGVIKTLQALDLKVLTSEEYNYPKRFLYPLEIDNTSRLNQEGTRSNSDSTKKETLLKNAQKDFEKAISLDPTYTTAFINLACVFDLLGNPEASIGKIKELPKDKQETQNAKRILAIAYYHADNETKAEAIWKEIE